MVTHTLVCPLVQDNPSGSSDVGPDQAASLLRLCSIRATLSCTTFWAAFCRRSISQSAAMTCDRPTLTPEEAGLLSAIICEFHMASKNRVYRSISIGFFDQLPTETGVYVFA